MANQRFSKKVFNICIVVILIIIIIFIAVMFTLNYDVKGETNMPFNISKISIISTVDGKDVENSTNKWEINAIQNNDVYIYVEKNKDYHKQETISSIIIDNFNIKQPNIGGVKIYKPIESENFLFKNDEENLTQKLEIVGKKTTDTRKLEISNQGGVACFRCANNNIGTYVSNDDEEINYKELIKKLNINEQDINAKITFDITINLDSGKNFRAEGVEIEIPNQNLIVEGTVGYEYNELEKIIFKRI